MKPLKLSFLLILIGSVLLLSGAGESSKPTDPKKTEPQSKESKLDYDKRDKQPNQTEKSTVFDQDPNSPSEYSKSQQQTNQQETQPRPPTNYSWWFNFWLVVFTGCLVLVGAGQIIVYAVQAYYMRRGLKLTEQVAEAAQKSADTTNRQVELIANLERPWMIVNCRGLENWDLVTAHRQPGKPFHVCVRYSIINTGRSQAFLTNLSGELTFQPYPVPEEGLEFESNPFAKLVIPPTKDHSGEVWLDVGADDVEQMKLRRRCIIFCGLVGYSDTLWRNHVTRFCMYWYMLDANKPETLKFVPVGPPNWIEYT